MTTINLTRCIWILLFSSLMVLSACQKERLRLPPNQLYINAYDSFTGESVTDVFLYRRFHVGGGFWDAGWGKSDTLQADTDNLILNDSLYSPYDCMENVCFVHPDYHGIWTYSGFCDKDSTMIDTINFEVKPIKNLYLNVKPQNPLGYIKIRVLDNEREYSSFRTINWVIGEHLIDCDEGLPFQDTTIIVPVIQADTLMVNVTYIETDVYGRKEKVFEVITDMREDFGLEVGL